MMVVEIVSTFSKKKPEAISKLRRSKIPIFIALLPSHHIAIIIFYADAHNSQNVCAYLT